MCHQEQLRLERYFECPGNYTNDSLSAGQDQQNGKNFYAGTVVNKTPLI
jgi:hypothetical protein